MRPSALLTIAIAIGVVAGTTALLSRENPDRPVAADTTQALPGSATKPAPGGSTQASTGQNAAAAPQESPLAFMLANVASDYRHAIRYPEWSTPLSPSQARAYQGNNYHPVALPLGDTGHFTVTLEKYRFTRDEPILVAASISGPQIVDDTLSATLEAIGTRDAVTSTTLSRADGLGSFAGVLDSDHAPGEYRLIVSARVDGRIIRHASTLTIEPDLGEFKGLDDPFVRNNNLVIPVRFKAREGGFYALAAQLYHGQTPIAQLSTEQRLDGGTGRIELRAHGTVLAHRDVDGHLELRHLHLRQLPARPGDRTHHAFGPDAGYEFAPPDLGSLRDEPVVTPESEQRAELLQRLADKF